MRPSSVFSTPLVIATTAGAVVAFLFLIDTSINSDATRKNTNAAVTNHNTNVVACTDEAKLCPDGSAVGRTGPNCEFTECPGEAGNRNTQITTRACVTDSDCELQMCSGCLSKVYLATHPILPLCAVYTTQNTCSCQAGVCTTQ